MTIADLRLARAAAIALAMTDGVRRFISLSAETQRGGQQSGAGCRGPRAAPEPLSADELEVLVARIALYPDELVAAISQASLYPLQIVEADRFLDRLEKDKTLKPKEDWDGSVISLLNYPEVVKMMSEDLDWTQSLGDALTYQQKDVLIAIQQLRDEAVAKGIIKSDDKIQVVQSGDNVIIQPTVAETIYVPQYEPQMLYAPELPASADLLLSGTVSQLLLPDRRVLRRRGDRRPLGRRHGLGRLGRLGRRLGRRRPRYRLQQLPQQHQRQGQLEGRRLEECRPVEDQLRQEPAGQFRSHENQGRHQGERRQLHSKPKRRTSGGIALPIAADRAPNRDIRKSALGDRNRAPAARSAQAKQAERRSRQGQSSTGRPAGANRPSGKPKAGARVDRRPSKPSALGNVDRGKASKVNSNRGRQSMGGGARGGGQRHVTRGGGQRAVARGGGGRGGAARGGGGGGVAGGGGGGGGGGRRR